MKKKQRNRKFGGSKDPVEERGFTVVFADKPWKRVYLSSHPDGIAEKEAQRLSDGLGVETKVVPVGEVF